MPKKTNSELIPDTVVGEIVEFDASPPPMVTAALLDEAGVYQCMETLPANQLTDRHLPHITVCDLPPGQYRWDVEKAAFVALPKKTPEKQVKEPNVLRAIAKGLLSLQQAGHVFPDETRDWLAWYAQSVDFKG